VRDPIVATKVVLLNQIPGVVVEESGEVVPVQRANDPVIAPGNGLTVIT
jgi:predicted RNA-binding protein with PUA domain